MKVELLYITENSEKLIELAGRTCYDSSDKITDESSSKFVKMLINSGHESVLEHASATFRISGVSRALSHQLVRHRLASYSQRSQRYCFIDKNDAKRTPWSRFTIQDEEDIANLYKRGKTTNGISKLYGCSQQTISNILSNLDTDIRSRGNHCFSKGSIFLPSELTSVSAQIIGFVFADGNVFHSEKTNSKRLSIKIKDEQYIKQLAFALDKPYKILKKEGLCSLSFASEMLFDTLVDSYGCIPNKSKNMYSDKLNNIPEAYLNHFIRGYFEGDGSILWYPKYNKRMLVFTSGDCEFLNWLDTLLSQKCNIPKKNKLREVSNLGTAFQLVYQKKSDIESILKWMYQDFELDLCLFRKLFIASNFIPDFKDKLRQAVTKFTIQHNCVIPPTISDNPEALALFTEAILLSEQMYKELNGMSIHREDSRYVLLNAHTTEIVMTANFREWRYVLKERLSKKAQWEIREMAERIFNILCENAPNVFGDLGG